MPGAILADQGGDANGTGHAVRAAMEAAGSTSGTVLVAYGDTPLPAGDSLRGALAVAPEAAQRNVSILSGQVEDPFGLGRVLLDEEGDVEAIVEERDATAEKREIRQDQLRCAGLRRGVPDSALRIGNDDAKG